jgi:hypothetical protein
MIRVVVQDENGNEVSEAVDVPARVIARPEDHRFSCLRFVDPYGDTVFNSLQLAALLEDFRLLRDIGDGREHDAALEQIEVLIERCRARPHLYLKLIGD